MRIEDIEPLVTQILLLLYPLEMAIVVVAWARVYMIYREEEGHRSILWRGLVWIFGMVVAIGLLLFFPAIFAILNLPRLPFTGIGITLGVEILLGTVIAFWVLIERVRARHPVIEPEPEKEEGEDDGPTDHAVPEG